MIANKIATNILVIVAVMLSFASAISRNNTAALKNIVKQSQRTAEARGHEYGFLEGYGSDLAYGKSDYYWLIPLVIVIGFGALLLPLLGTLMTTMITTGTINLTAGRRKRDTNGLKQANVSEFMLPLLTKLEDALEKFEKQIKADVSPLMKTVNRNNH